MAKITSHDNLSITSSLRKITWNKRIALFLFILFGAIILTLAKPEALISHFFREDKNTATQLLTRIWIFASLITTVVISVWIYLKFLIKLYKEISIIEDENREARVTTLIIRSGITLLCIPTLVVIIIFALIDPDSQLRIINLLSGVVLVSFLTFLDINLYWIDEELLCELKSHIPDNETIDEEIKKVLSQKKEKFITSRDIVLKLDIPILIGVIITWIVGYLFIPTVLDKDALIYSDGFATGATALQIIVGNITFEIINVCSSA